MQRKIDRYKKGTDDDGAELTTKENDLMGVYAGLLLGEARKEYKSWAHEKVD